jgi:hypothetical protein
VHNAVIEWWDQCYKLIAQTHVDEIDGSKHLFVCYELYINVMIGVMSGTS